MVRGLALSFPGECVACAIAAAASVPVTGAEDSSTWNL